MKRIVIATVLALGLAGCSSFLAAANGSVGGLLIMQATARYIEGAGNAEAQLGRAARVQKVAAEVRAAAENGDVSVESLRALAESKLPPDMSVSDRLLAFELINAVANYLDGKIGDGVISPEDLPSLDMLLRRVEFTAAQFQA